MVSRERGWWAKNEKQTDNRIHKQGKEWELNQATKLDPEGPLHGEFGQGKRWDPEPEGGVTQDIPGSDSKTKTLHPSTGTACRIGVSRS